MKWYSFAELEKEYGVSRSSIKWQRSQGKFPNARQFTNKTGILEWEIPDSDLNLFKEEATFVQNSYSSAQLRKLLGCSTQMLDKMINNGTFKKIKKISRKWYIEKSEVDLYLSRTVFKLNDFYNSEEVIEILNISKATFKKAFNSKLFSNTRTYLEVDYVSKEEINRYKNIIDTSYNTNETSEILNMKVTSIGSKCQKGDFNGAVKLPFSYGWFIPKTTVHNYKDSLDKKTKINNEYDAFPILTKEIDVSTLPQTYKLYDMYVRDYLKRSRKTDKIQLSKDLTNAFKSFHSSFNKELFLYTDEELNELLPNIKINSISFNTLIQFINFLRGYNGVKCRYQNEYYVQPKKKVKKEEAIYSKEEWTSYYYHLTDIDTHILKAIQDQKYACTWLFLLLHLVLAWRPSDLLKMPNIPLEEIGIYSFNWFYENKFTLSQGERVINYVRHTSQFIRTDKTGAKVHFVTTVDLIIPISIALIISEIHRRNNKHDILMMPFKKTKPKKERSIKQVLEDKKELYNFISLKANRTLLTYGFEQASKTRGKAYLAYELSSFMRSHKKGKFEISGTTKEYIYLTNNDGSIDDTSYQLFRRGMFGWLYTEMINVAYGKEMNNFTTEEETQFIENIQKVYSPSDLENVGQFLNSQLQRRKSVVQELLEMGKEELQMKIKKLIKKEMPAKSKNAQCLKSGNCPYISSETCFGCDYLIPEFHLLYTIKDELKSLMDKLDSTPQNQKTKKIKLTHFIFRMLHLLTEVKKEYSKVDESFMDNFFDLKSLEERLNELQKSKFEFVTSEG